MALWINVAAAQIATPLPAAGNVALPLDEYNRLMELSAKPAKKSDAPPVPFAIQRADINLTVAGGTASGTVQLEGEVFGAGAVDRRHDGVRRAPASGRTTVDVGWRIARGSAQRPRQFQRDPGGGNARQRRGGKRVGDGSGAGRGRRAVDDAHPG
jgi:hypothetical protein